MEEGGSGVVDWSDDGEATAVSARLLRQDQIDQRPGRLAHAALEARRTNVPATSLMAAMAHRRNQGAVTTIPSRTKRMKEMTMRTMATMPSSLSRTFNGSW